MSILPPKIIRHCLRVQARCNGRSQRVGYAYVLHAARASRQEWIHSMLHLVKAKATATSSSSSNRAHGWKADRRLRMACIRSVLPH